MDLFEYTPWTEYKEEQPEAEGFRDGTDYTQPSGEEEVRGQLQSLHSQTKAFINDTLVEGINNIDSRLTTAEGITTDAVTNITSAGGILSVTKTGHNVNVELAVSPQGMTADGVRDIVNREYLPGITTSIESAVTTAEAYTDDRLSITTGTLAAGDDTITLNNTDITPNSILSFYTSIYGVNPTSVTVNTGNVVLEFDAQETSMIVGVRVDGTL